MEEEDLPPMLRGHGIEVPYTPAQLAPTLRRLETALRQDFDRGYGTPQQRLAAAWTRIAELRLPRKAVPTRVLDDVEDLVIEWDRYDGNGIVRYAATLTDGEVERERARIERMLHLVQDMAAENHAFEVVPTE